MLTVLALYAAAAANAQTVGQNCTLLDLAVGQFDVVDNSTATLSLAKEALRNTNVLEAFPVLSTHECWAACLRLAPTDECESWATYEMPIVINDAPWMQCRLYKDDSPITTFNAGGGDSEDIEQDLSLNRYKDVIVHYGEVGTAFGLEFDCADDVVDSECLGTNERFCATSLPSSPLTFDDSCTENQSCVVGCCAIRTPTLDGIVPSDVSVMDLSLSAECYEQMTVNSLVFPEQCVQQCLNTESCSFSILESIRGGESLGPNLYSTCRLYSCTGLGPEGLTEADRDALSSMFVGPLEYKLPEVARHWNIFLPALTAAESVLGSHDRVRPEHQTTTTTTTTTTTLPPTTTIATTTEAPCILTGYDNNAQDLTASWGVYTVDQCQERCAENALCSAWVWVQGEAGCYLKVGPGDAFPIQSDVNIFTGPPFCKDDDDTIARPKMSGVLYNQEPKNSLTYDISVGIWQPNFSGCHSLCELHPHCQTWTYITSTQQCFLKAFDGAVNTPDQVELVPGENLFSGGSELNTPFLGDEFLDKEIPANCFEMGVNYLGADLYNFWTATPIDCFYKCQEDKQCLYFTYNQQDNQCFLKFDARSRILNILGSGQKHISGSRDCPDLVNPPPLCQTTVVRPEPHPSCDLYAQYFTPDKERWVNLELGATESVSTFNSWWKKEETEVDLTNTHAWFRVGFAFVVPSTEENGLCNLSDYTPEEESCWDRAEDYFPFAMEAEVVAVAPRAMFTGFGHEGAVRPPTEWAIFEKTVIDMSNHNQHHGFFFDYSKPTYWPINATAPNNFAMSTVHMSAKLLDLTDQSPVRPTELYVIFCIWGEPQPEIMVDQPDKHTETCGRPLILVPTDPSASEYTLVESTVQHNGSNELYSHQRPSGTA